MKRLVLLLLAALLLSGCSGKDRSLEEGIAFRSELLAAGGCRFTAEVTADYGDKLHSFTMDCEADGLGNLEFAVTAPQTIAGIGGTLSEEGGRIVFEDTLLCVPYLTEDQLNPVSAPWIFLHTLRSGYIRSACREEELLRLTIDDSYDEDAMQMDIWLSGDRLPVRGDILYDGKRILTIDVTEFDMV